MKTSEPDGCPGSGNWRHNRRDLCAIGRNDEEQEKGCCKLEPN